jgi:hypothetical protein
MVLGKPIFCSAWLIAFSASPSDAPGARLKESVTSEKGPRWLIDSGAVVGT